MAITRASLGRGPARVTFGGATLFTRDDLVPRHSPVWNPVVTSMYGEVDKVKSDLVIRFGMRLWGAWENISVLFPDSIINPTVGASLFGTSDSAAVILARNGDQITYHNAQITRLADLYLGVDSDLFAADVEITALLKNNANPEDANAYYTLATAQAYSDNVFAKTNFKRSRITGAWNAKTGFTTITPQRGVNVGWTLDLAPVRVDGLGTVDFTLRNFMGGCRCIPIGPSLAQIESASRAQGLAHGGLASTSSADLTWSASGISVVLYGAQMTEHGYAFGVEPLRVGEMAWVTTRGFSAGTPTAVVDVA
jgi:hypothetical protein